MKSIWFIRIKDFVACHHCDKVCIREINNIEPNHAAGVKLIFLILTVASAGILFYYVTAALKMSKRKPYG